jgi:hypothetical protein
MESQPSPSPSASPSPGPEAVETGPSLAEDLPELYRTILGRVAELERIGARREGGRVREAATRIYAASWDEAARRDLTQLLARADRAIAAGERRRSWWLRWRSAPAR